MANKSDTTCDRSTEIGSQIMEHRLNSKPDTSAVFSKSESPIPSLKEYYILTRAINHWDETKYVTYNTNKQAYVLS